MQKKKKDLVEFETKVCSERIVVEISSRTYEGLRGGIPGRILKESLIITHSEFWTKFMAEFREV